MQCRVPVSTACVVIVVVGSIFKVVCDEEGECFMFRMGLSDAVIVPWCTRNSFFAKEYVTETGLRPLAGGIAIVCHVLRRISASK